MPDMTDMKELNELNNRENQVRLDYNRAKYLANQMEDIGKTLLHRFDEEFDGTLSHGRLSWDGDNAKAFWGKCDATRAEVKKTANDIIITADKIVVMAKNTYDAEMQAIQVARDRIYNTP